MSAKFFIVPSLILLLAVSLPADEADKAAVPAAATQVAELEAQIQSLNARLVKLSEQLHKAREAALQGSDGYAENQQRISNLLTQLSALSKDKTMEPEDLAARRKALTDEITTLSQQISATRKAFEPDEKMVELHRGAQQLQDQITALQEKVVQKTAEIVAAAKAAAEQENETAAAAGDGEEQ